MRIFQSPIVLVITELLKPRYPLPHLLLAAPSLLLVPTLNMPAHCFPDPGAATRNCAITRRRQSTMQPHEQAIFHMPLWAAIIASGGPRILTIHHASALHSSDQEPITTCLIARGGGGGIPFSVVTLPAPYSPCCGAGRRHCTFFSYWGFLGWKSVATNTSSPGHLPQISGTLRPNSTLLLAPPKPTIITTLNNPPLPRTHNLSQQRLLIVRTTTPHDVA